MMNTRLPTRLILLTSSFPYDRGETFLDLELKYLSSRFDSVVVVPYKTRATSFSRELPENVRVFDVLRPRRFFALKLLWYGVFNRVSPYPFLAELREHGFFLTRPWLWFRWLGMSLSVRMLASRSSLRQLFCDASYRQVVYSYWGTMVSAVFGSTGASCPYVVRLHGVDIYAEREDNGGYIFGRSALMKKVSLVAHVSRHGLEYLRVRYPEAAPRLGLFRLGVPFAGRSPYVDDGVLKLITCSRIIPLKRLDLLVEALGLLSLPVRWTHIGDGPGRSELEARIKDLPGMVEAHIAGFMPNDRVVSYYVEHPCDLFLNISSTEGVPVTIMEALSSGIPVLATDVGGTSELVDESVGRLLPANISAAALAKSLTQFAAIPREQMFVLREHAYERWKDRADAARNYPLLAEALMDLLDSRGVRG